MLPVWAPPALFLPESDICPAKFATADSAPSGCGFVASLHPLTNHFQLHSNFSSSKARSKGHLNSYGSTLR